MTSGSGTGNERAASDPMTTGPMNRQELLRRAVQELKDAKRRLASLEAAQERADRDRRDGLPPSGWGGIG